MFVEGHKIDYQITYEVNPIHLMNILKYPFDDVVVTRFMSR